MSDITLRHASLADAERLHNWRNDIEARNNSLDTDPIPFERHVEWLRAALGRGNPTILIAEEQGSPVGVVRYAKINDDEVKLSWIVAPSARGRGIATHMVTLTADGPLRKMRIHADIKAANEASIRVAQAAGMTVAHRRDDVLTFQRAPLP